MGNNPFLNKISWGKWVNDNTNNNLRNNNSYKKQIANTDGYKNSFFNRTIHMWNNIDQQYKQIIDPTIYKDGLYDESINVINSYHAYLRRLGISSLRYGLLIVSSV